nr:hypothetical protein [Tanacetum cinerariifolium]
MEHQDDVTDFIPPSPYDLPLSGGHTPRSDEGRPNINKLMVICTQLSNRVLALEQSKTAQDLVIKKMQKKVKRIKRKLNARTLRMTLVKIGTFRRKSFDKENVSKHGRNLKKRPMFKESDFVPMDSEVVKDSRKKDESCSKQARRMRKRAGSKLKPKSPKKVKVMKEQASTADEQEKEEFKLCLKIV